MRSIPVVEAKAHFSSLLAAVEEGEEISITRHGRPIARLVPSPAPSAADVFRPFWDDTRIDLAPPEDVPPEAVGGFD